MFFEDKLYMLLASPLIFLINIFFAKILFPTTFIKELRHMPLQICNEPQLSTKKNIPSQKVLHRILVTEAFCFVWFYNGKKMIIKFYTKV